MNKKVSQALILIVQFGINMVVPIALMCALGVYLDRKFHTSFWTILFFILGAVAGAQNVFKMARRVYSMPADRELSVRHKKKESALETSKAEQENKKEMREDFAKQRTKESS